MNILITGAFGFVGTKLSKAINTPVNHSLIAVDINKPENHIYDKFYSWNNLELIDWDKVDAIIHLAGKAHDTKNISEEKSYFDINLGLTKQIFDYFLQSTASKFIFFSSVKAVADSVKGDLLTEEDTAAPQTAYGRSKLAAEQYILNRSSVFGLRSSDKKVYILRPSMIHGPGNKGNLNLLYKVVSKGIPWPLGAFENKRSFASMENVAFVIKQIIEKDIEPGTYHLADDEPLSTKQLISLIAASKNKKSHILNINKKLINWGAKVGGLLHLPLNPERLKKLTESYVVSNQKLKQALKINKMPVGAKEGMIKTLRSFEK